MEQNCTWAYKRTVLLTVTKKRKARVEKTFTLPCNDRLQRSPFIAMLSPKIACVIFRDRLGIYGVKEKLEHISVISHGASSALPENSARYDVILYVGIF